jgi:WD40 repeat protein
MRLPSFFVSRVCCKVLIFGRSCAMVVLISTLNSSLYSQTILYDAKATNIHLIPSPDGKFFATKDRKIVSVWDRVTKKSQQYRLPSLVGSMTFSPDSRLLAFGTNDFDKESFLHTIGVVKVLDVMAKKEVKTLTVLQDGKDNVSPIGRLKFSSDGKVLAVGSNNHTSTGGLVTLFDMKTNKVLSQFEVLPGEVLDVCFTPDGANIIAGARGDDTKSDLIIWDLKLKKEKHALKGYKAPIYAIACSPKGGLMASGGGHHVGGVTIRDPGLPASELMVWEWTTGKRIKVLTGHQSAILALAFTVDGKLLTSGDLSGEIRIWDMTSFREVSRFAAHQDSISTVSFSTDGKTMMTTGSDGKAKSWQLNKILSRPVQKP